MKPLIVLGLCFIILSASIPATKAQGLDTVTTSVNLFASDVAYTLKSWFISVQAWVAMYLMGDVNYHNYLISEQDKMRAYHETLRQQSIDPTCCKPSGCIINSEQLCATVCTPCDEVLQELNQYYSGVHNE